MDTIVRNKYGYINIDVTIMNTVKVLSKKSGYISIDRLQAAINNQLTDQREYVKRKVIVRGVVRMLE